MNRPSSDRVTPTPVPRLSRFAFGTDVEDDSGSASNVDELAPILPDLRRLENNERTIRMSRLVATVVLRSASRSRLHPSTSNVVEQYLAGRSPSVAIEPDVVTMRFDVDDESLESWQRAQHFGLAVGRLLDLEPGTPIELSMNLIRPIPRSRSK